MGASNQMTILRICCLMCSFSSIFTADILSTLMKQWHWDHVTIVSDKQHSYMTNTIISSMKADFGHVQHFRLFTWQSHDTATSVLRHICNPYGPLQNVVLICQNECILEFLTQANVHDTINDEQGMFTYLTSWLVIGSNLNIAAIGLAAGNIINIALLQHDTYCTHKLSLCVAFNVYTSYWKPANRTMDHVGTVWNHGKADMRDSIYPNAKYGLNGRHFTVVALEWPPFIVHHKNGTFTGFNVDLLDLLKMVHNFTYAMVPSSDWEWGVLNNGTWTGIVGDLVNKRADFAMACLVRTYDREMVADFPIGYYEIYACILYKKNVSINWLDTFLRPFAMVVWVCLMGAVPVMVFALYLLATFLKKQILTTSNRGGRGPPFQTALVFTFGILTNQGTTNSKNGSMRVLMGSFWIFAIILIATYSGNLVAFLTVDKHKAPFRTLNELVAHDDYLIGVLGGAIHIDILKGHDQVISFQEMHLGAYSSRLEQYAEKGPYKKVWDKIQKQKQKDLTSSDHHLHLARVKEGSYAYLTDYVGAKLEMNNDCSLAVMEEFFFPTSYAATFQNNSAYRRLFSDSILKLQASGVSDFLLSQHWPSQTKDGCYGDHTRAMTLEDMQSIFYALGSFILLAVVVLLVEKLNFHLFNSTDI